MDAKNEILMSALDAYNRAAASISANPQAAVRAESRLFDAALAAGMPFDEAAPHEWAAVKITRWLVAA